MVKSAGILLFKKDPHLKFLLAHPGGPFWKNKDEGAWSIPKGILVENESPLAAAIREFKEETGADVNGDFIELTPQKQKSGKIIYAWALEGDFDRDQLFSNTFEMEWPPKSGRMKSFSEVDCVEWFDYDVAIQKVVLGQVQFLKEVQLLMK